MLRFVSFFLAVSKFVEYIAGEMYSALEQLTGLTRCVLMHRILIAETPCKCRERMGSILDNTLYYFKNNLRLVLKSQ